MESGNTPACPRAMPPARSLTQPATNLPTSNPPTWSRAPAKTYDRRTTTRCVVKRCHTVSQGGHAGEGEKGEETERRLETGDSVRLAELEGLAGLGNCYRTGL